MQTYYSKFPTSSGQVNTHWLLAILRNIKRERQVWGRISKVIAKDSVPAPVAGMFYQAVVAAILLYGSETWVAPPHELRALEGFHVEAARRITGMRPKKRGETWV